jgi:hypothetical protein
MPPPEGTAVNLEALMSTSTLLSVDTTFAIGAIYYTADRPDDDIDLLMRTA